MLLDIKEVWDKHFVPVNGAKFQIDLTPPASGPRISASHLAGWSQCDFELIKIYKLLKMTVIVPDRKKWTAPKVFAYKMDGALRSCVQCRDLNAISAWNSYQLPTTEQNIQLRGDARVFSTLDASSRYLQIEIFDKDQD